MRHLLSAGGDVVFDGDARGCGRHRGSEGLDAGDRPPAREADLRVGPPLQFVAVQIAQEHRHIHGALRSEVEDDTGATWSRGP